MIYQLCISGYLSVFCFLTFFFLYIYIACCCVRIGCVCVTAVGHVASHVYLVSGIKKQRKKSFSYIYIPCFILYIRIRRRRRKWSDLIGAVPERRLNMIGRPCPSITRQAQHTQPETGHITKEKKKNNNNNNIKNILLVVVMDRKRRRRRKKTWRWIVSSGFLASVSYFKRGQSIYSI